MTGVTLHGTVFPEHDPAVELISDEMVAAGAGVDPGVDSGAGALLQRAVV